MSERSIFMEALEFDDPQESAAYLGRACGDDQRLRERVEALLRSHRSGGSFVLDRGPAVEVSVTADLSPAAMHAGTVIGPYKLLEQIGEGGMGVVYMAEQIQPVRREVALKIIKPGMDTKQVIVRFEAERQALALMDHTNIARVLDAGATQSGQPYFIMELVKGIPITDYCDRNRLAIADRLELFLQVCQAVQHAHHKGIIHRDIKPSNVLVALIDGAAVPKIIDFGVAKAIGQSLTEKTLCTSFAQLIGTPLYMSPEQAEFSGVDVDTRSDVYALGVLLYELLTDTTPFDQETFRKAAFDEIRRIIREQEPPRPSTRILLPLRRAGREGLPLSTLEVTATMVSANRRTDARRLRKSMREELDWIVMKCLEKDRRRRYQTANALVADLRRYLNHEPVEAGPPSAWYRLRKYARRNRAVLTTVAVVAGALVAGTAVSIWAAKRAMWAEGLAQSRLEAERQARGEADRLLGEVTQQRNQADSARREADRRATEAHEVVDFLINDLIGAASPSRTQGQIPTVDQVLAQADQNIAQRFADRPLIEASIRHTLGKAYEELGQYTKAERHAVRAAELRLEHLGPEHADTIAAQNALGWALFQQRKTSAEEAPGKLEEAHILLTKVLAIARKALGPEHEETLQAMHNLAAVLIDLVVRCDEARALAEELLAIRKRVLGPEHPQTLAAMRILADNWLAYTWQDDHPDYSEKAKQIYDQILHIELRDRPNHPNTFITMINLARCYHNLRQFDLELDMRRRIIDGLVHVLGLAHPSTQEAIGRYLRSALSEGIHWEQARKDLEQILDRSRREPGPEAKVTSSSIATCLALLLREHGRFAEARPLLEQTLDEALRLRQELPKRLVVENLRGLTQFLLGRWPGLAPGISPAARPPASFSIEAPFRAVSPIADGQITLGEYGPGVEATFEGDANPGRMYRWLKSRSKTPDDLSVRVLTAYTNRSLFLAFQVRDQFVDADEFNARSPYYNDDVEVFINGDHVANDMPPGFLAVGAKGNREGFQLIADARGHQFTVATGFTNADWKVGTSRTPDGYIVEFEIPLALIDTWDGPEYVPAASGSELLVNFGFADNDAPVSDQTDYGIFWAEDPALSPVFGGEDFWTVSLRLVPKPSSSP